MNRFLTETHWQVIYFLRKGFIRDHVVPQAKAVAAAFDLNEKTVAALFPDGYDRGALKIAGLKNGDVGRKH
ncbi:MAG: TusE/DsrC/DsvC family sulfur relay protein [candidate division Zixibacteria bacterium]|nr:TusE/DsrC/DsvC family sulfur relay protein [candidate division Zixibacteria bacterium]